MTDDARSPHDVVTEDQPAPRSGRPLPERKPRGRIHQKFHSHPVLGLTTKVVVGIVGTLVVVAGVIMMVTPGPAFVMIPLGLAILATEFDFARRWLHWAREKAEEAKRKSDEMDPAVRRRRLVLTGLTALLVVAAVWTYVAIYDWPSFALDSWDWVQSMAGWVPDLPGM